MDVLESFWAGHNHLSGTLGPLAGLECLTSVCLPSNKLEGDIELLGKLPNLDDVDLRNNLLTDDGAEEIFIRRQQAVVKLGGNPGFNEERLRVFDAQTRFNLQDTGP
mmetsp:Transcript_14508/g.38255  ORF Transcript_14508/g.38255 Transcript_14508/m.38255 type:complete len:107 (-) Transcript_14508:560-880(-)